jgi:hypothetical protein
LFHTARQCFSTAGEQRPDITDKNDPKTNTGDIVTVPRPECDKAKNGGECTRKIENQDNRGGDVVLGGSLPGGNRVDTTVKVDANDVQITRDGSGVTGDAKLDARVLLWEAIEFIDYNDDCRINERDTVVNRILLKDLIWTAVVKTDGNFYTITVSESRGWFTFIFVVSGDKYTVGSRSIPAGARITMDTSFPWQKTNTKLLLVFKIVVAGGYTVDAVNGQFQNLVVYNTAGTRIGNFECDQNARVGADGDVNIILGLDGDTTESDKASGVAVVGTAHSYTLRACVDVLGAPSRVVYDPVLSPTEFTPGPPTNAAASCHPRFILALLAAILCAVLRL